MFLKVPSEELESRKLAGVVQIYKNGRRKNMCWFNRGVIREDVISGMKVRYFIVQLSSGFYLNNTCRK